MKIGARRTVQPGQCLLAFSGLFLFLSIQTLDFEVGCILPQGDEVVIYVLWWQFSFATRYSSHRLSGVLFLDELPEFHRDVLEVMRQPLEDGKVTISRSTGSATYPAGFMLVCAMNPCKCGWYGHPSGRCRCSQKDVEKYHAKISGPLLDRIDIIVEVPALEFDELTEPSAGEPSRAIRARVNAARAVQRARYGDDTTTTNAHMGPRALAEFCALSPECEQLMHQAFDSMALTARSYDRILRVARTIADLDGAQTIGLAHLAEAIQYRTYDFSVAEP